jgi:hypothetical protein
MARIEITDNGVLDIVLSERNLLSLLSKLYTPGSACELHGGDVPDGFRFVRLRGQIDEVHYVSPTRLGAPAGEMHPVTETILNAIKEALDELGIEDINQDD